VNTRLCIAAKLSAFVLLCEAGVSAQTKPSCTYFTVVSWDKFNEVTRGLSAADVKWFQKTFAKKFPTICYAEPALAVPIVFFITVAPDVSHGTRAVNQASTQTKPVSGTITGQDGNTSQASGAEETTTTRSTAVSRSAEYGIYTLSLGRRLSDGTFDVAQTFQQKGFYSSPDGNPPGGKRDRSIHTLIEEAIKWMNASGLTDPKQSVFQPAEPAETVKP
jgi:hypothetical protein